MTIYIDSDCRCHATGDGTMTALETDVFEGKCAAFLEGYRYVPPGTAWTRADGVTFTGEMVAPWKDYAVLAACQRQYEATQQELTQAYQEGVNSV
ncbi:hypothetical protein MR626_01420 [bacterium]|nr:hypothetical protein [bacterium]